MLTYKYIIKVCTDAAIHSNLMLTRLKSHLDRFIYLVVAFLISLCRFFEKSCFLVQKAWFLCFTYFENFKKFIINLSSILLRKLSDTILSTCGTNWWTLRSVENCLSNYFVAIFGWVTAFLHWKLAKIAYFLVRALTQFSCSPLYLILASTKSFRGNEHIWPYLYDVVLLLLHFFLMISKVNHFY